MANYGGPDPQMTELLLNALKSKGQAAAGIVSTIGDTVAKGVQAYGAKSALQGLDVTEVGKSAGITKSDGSKLTMWDLSRGDPSTLAALMSMMRTRMAMKEEQRDDAASLFAESLVRADPNDGGMQTRYRILDPEAAVKALGEHQVPAAKSLMADKGSK